MPVAAEKKPAAVKVLDAGAIVEAAQAVFLREGYAASVETIIREAGIARQSLYNHFANKKALFQAVIENFTTEHMKPLLTLELPAGTTLPEGLTLLGGRYMEGALHPDSLAMNRVISSANLEFPEIGAVIYAAGPQHWIPALATFLRAQAAAGKIRTTANFDTVAESFFGALVGAPRFRHLMNLKLNNSPQERAAYVREIVDLYVAGLHYKA